MSAITVKPETINPKRAAEYLAMSAGNRNLRKQTVAVYARTMMDGGWGDSNDCITFDSLGHLANGHHRLNAVIESGVTINAFVMRGVAPETFGHIDRLASRTHGDVFGLAGFVNGGRVAAVAGFVWRYENGMIETGTGGGTSDELIDVPRRDPGIEESVRIAERAAHVIPTSMLGFVHYAGSGLRREEADRFVDALASGEGLSKGDPALTLREKMLRSKGPGRSLVAGGTGRIAALRMICRAWNSYANGEKLSQCVIETRTNVFPSITGCTIKVRA